MLDGMEPIYLYLWSFSWFFRMIAGILLSIWIRFAFLLFHISVLPSLKTKEQSLDKELVPYKWKIELLLHLQVDQLSLNPRSSSYLDELLRHWKWLQNILLLSCSADISCVQKLNHNLLLSKVLLLVLNCARNCLFRILWNHHRWLERSQCHRRSFRFLARKSLLLH